MRPSTERTEMDQEQIIVEETQPRFTKRQVTIVGIVSASIAAVAGVVIRSKMEPLLASEVEIVDLSV